MHAKMVSSVVLTPWNYFDGVVGVWGACMLACLHACMHACMQAGFRGWCGGLFSGCSWGCGWFLSGCPALSCLGSGGALRVSVVAYRVPPLFLVLPALVALSALGVFACLHACMRVSGGAPRGLWRCCGALCGVVSWGCLPVVPPAGFWPVRAGSGAVLGRVWGWCGPRGCRLEAGGGGCRGFSRPVCGFCGAVGPGGGPLGAREGPCRPGVHHGQVRGPREGPRSSPALPGHTGSGQAQHGVLSRPPAPCGACGR